MEYNRRVTESSAAALLRADLVHMVESHSTTGFRWWVEVVVRVLLVPRLRAVCLFRASQAMQRRRLAPLALWLQGRAVRASGAEISPSAQIGPGLCLMHSVGVVIGPDVRMGEGVRVYQGVTLGDGRLPGQPTIGDHVTLGAGACVLGGVKVGDRSIIGSGVRVTRDVPEDHVIVDASGEARPRRPGADARLDGLAHEAVATAPPASSDRAVTGEMTRAD